MQQWKQLLKKVLNNLKNYIEKAYLKMIII